MTSFLVAGGIALVVIVGMLVAYRRFTALRARVQRDWQDVDAELERRHALVPALVNAVRRYPPHDPRLLDTTTSLNLTAMAVRREADAQAIAEQALEHALRQVLAAGNGHRELKADDEFLALQQQLGELDTRIEELRDVYNADTRRFDRLVQTFPTLIFAQLFGFAPEAYFEFEAVVGQAPTPVLDLSPWT